MKLKNITAVALISLLASCSTPKDIVYFQDLKPDAEVNLTNASRIRIEPQDKITIMVSAQDPRLSAQFNLQYVSQSMSHTASSNSVQTGGNDRLIPYTVNSYGDIDFPVLGEIHVAGLTREEIAMKIKKELQSQDLIKDPVVTVEFYNLAVTVLGEVNSPGRYGIGRDQYTLLDVIGDAGDLTINGKRENVMIIRQENGKEKVYEVNLTDAKNLYSSPAYYVRQNDVIYVAPNNPRIRQSTANGNTVQTYGFWMSTISFLLSIGAIIVPLTR